MLCAWIDESSSDNKKDPKTYILTASICDSVENEEIRSEMVKLKGSENKLHWRNETPRRHLQIAQKINELDKVMHLVVIRINYSGKEERARQKCLETLMWHLESLEVELITFESRGRSKDNKDLEFIKQLKSKKFLLQNIEISHKPGQDDSMLWIADSACGIIVQKRIGNSTYYDIVKHKIIEYIVDTD